VTAPAPSLRRAGGAAVLVLLAGCAHGPAAAPAPSPSPRHVATGATSTPLPVHVTSVGNGGSSTILTEMKQGRTLYTVRAASFDADSADNAGGTGNGSFVDPEITFFARDGGRTVTEAPKAVLTGADKSVLMTGGVRARSQDGNVLHCDRLRYDGQTERVHGDGHVRLQTPSGLVLVGDTLDADARLRNVLVRAAQ
jgi:LPS export ABC transporter protein LptC